MKLIAIAGSSSGSGKTRLACAILRAIPGLGAVKISPRAGRARAEWGGGEPGKDTDRFAESGAAMVARIVAPRGGVPEVWEGMRAALDSLPGVIVEGAGALALPGDRFTIFIAAPERLGERPGRDERLAAAADCIVVVRRSQASDPGDRPVLARHRGRVPVLCVSLEKEDWADEALLGAIRAFLK